MVKIYSAPEIALVYHVKNVLENHGIECITRGEHLAGATGGVAPVDAWIELWVLDDRQAEEARGIVEEIIQEGQPSTVSWTCPSCGETVEGQFSVCWQCGTERPGSSD